MTARNRGVLDSYLGRAIYTGLAEQTEWGFTSVIEGYNPSVAMGVTEDVWDLGGDFPYLTTASPYTIRSKGCENQSVTVEQALIKVHKLKAPKQKSPVVKSGVKQ